MALAWNAGWVNSPRGFKSRILRRWGRRCRRHTDAAPRPATTTRRGTRRGFAVAWHAVFFSLAGCLFFFFVLPRWPELSGDVSRHLGTALRIATGVVLALTALPLALTL